jgi:hypothetical protein
MPSFQIEHITTDDTPETSDTWSCNKNPATAMLVGGGIAAIIGCGWYYYKYHYVSFVSETWSSMNRDDTEN